MKLESLKSGKFAAQTLSPEMMRLVSGGRTFETDHIPTGKKDTSNYSRCGAKGELYDMSVTIDSTGQVVIQGVSTDMFKGTTADWYKNG
ncbi:MAG: hypothetical protein EOO20_11165 [Chryseobacterium sp.]|nr:MAG: hypothetical protein EOO20_11165 [Chryseobacterium sp.]